MYFDDRGANRRGGFDLRRLGGDEQRNADAGPAQLSNRCTQQIALTGSIEPAFGRALGPALGNDANGVWLNLAGDRHHLRRCRHFEIERFFDTGLKPRDVVIDDVAAVLAQMRGDAVGASRDRDLGRLDRIWMSSAAGVTQGRDVIDVDTKADGMKSGHVKLR